MHGISDDLKSLTQKIDGLVNDTKGLQSGVDLLKPLPETVKAIDARTTRIESIMIQAPWVKR